MEIVKAKTKTELVVEKASEELLDLCGELREHVMARVILVEKIRNRAHKEGFEDFEIKLLVDFALKPLDISAKEKSKLTQPFRPLNVKPASIPPPALRHEILEFKLPFSKIHSDIDIAKKLLCDRFCATVMKAKDSIWVQIQEDEVMAFVGGGIDEEYV